MDSQLKLLFNEDWTSFGGSSLSPILARFCSSSPFFPLQPKKKRNPAMPWKIGEKAWRFLLPSCSRT
ncbi:hypothetical protein SLEP1_g34367 [Rubroshorea leprosula]|uniref:Uncharacterized protein n=1 Tax=Rubroshorea leprosula TaxID=152421 RepID=A0AAV5KJS9_9ROSI|nr:hypothetical protein SLEP1_g34367 [Rubroshorea leprosula]